MSIFLLAALAFSTGAQAQVFDGSSAPFAGSLNVPRDFDLADIDGDGQEDVIGAYFGSFTVAWFKSDNATTPTLTPHTITDSLFGPVWVSAGDLDGDNDTDVAAAAFDGGRLVWYENSNGGMTWTEHVLLTGLDGPKFIYCYNMDGDDDLDLIATIRNTNEVIWFENRLSTNGTFVQDDVTSSLLAPQSAWPADLSGDGRPDLVVPGFGSNAVAWFEAPATDGGTWTRHDVDLAAGGVRDLRVVDIDGDHDDDILAALISDQEILWYENNGSAGGWAPHTIIPSYDGAASVSAADVDGDGDLDVASTAAFVDLVTWHENTNGDASTWAHHTLSDAWDFPLFVKFGDVDADGDPDLLSASNDDSVSALYVNRSPLVAFDSIDPQQPIAGDNIDPHAYTDTRNIVLGLGSATGNHLDLLYASADDFATSLSAPYYGQPNTPLVLPDADGPHVVSVRLSNLGWVGPATTDTITLDRVPPATQVTGPFSPVTQTSPVITFTYNASDETTSVHAVQLYYRRADQTPLGAFQPYGTPQSNTGTIDFDASSVVDGDDGLYHFQTIGTDPVGNTEALNANGDITIEFRWVRGGWMAY